MDEGKREPHADEDEGRDIESTSGADASASGEDGAAAPRRRHRGRRGGRRHRRSDHGEEAVATTDAEASVEAAGAETPLAAARAPAPRARGGRRRTRRGAEGGGEEAVVSAAAAPVAPTVAGAEVRGGQVPETPLIPFVDDGSKEQVDETQRARARRRGGRRRGRSAEGEPLSTELPPAPRAPEPLPVPERPLIEAWTPQPAGLPASVPAAAATERDAEPAPRPSRRRRQPSVDVDLPGHKEILVSTEGHELRVALVEDGRLAEIYIERPGKPSYAGNIYVGKVDNVIAGMDAAFVDIGLEKNAFLYVDDVAVQEGEERRGRKITQLLKARQDLLVQVNKDPMGSKGARATGQLSLAGRYLVYVPDGSGVGVSRRLPAEERDRLRELCRTLRAKNAGLIVRTAAEGKGEEELRRDLQFLARRWSHLKSRVPKLKAPHLLHAEGDVAEQVIRDLFNESFSTVLVDDRKQHAKLKGYLDKVSPELADRIRFYEGDAPLFAAHGIEEQIARALERRVELPSGGNLVIDHAEALTVIDVNTGRYTGGKGLEETITTTNLEAAREVVRQLRLRDIGGIIIIDFIDMAHARNRETVLAKLQAELESDRTKTYVVEISPLGLVEMTRQNITDGARGILTRECRSCGGRARVLSEETVALDGLRRLRELARESAAEAFLVEVNLGVAERMTADGRLRELEKTTGKQFSFEGSQALAVDTFRVLAEGTRDGVAAQCLPVREGQEVELELEHTLTYSPRDAVAHVEGYEVTVLEGRPFLGEKRKVRVTAVTRTGAFAVLTGRSRRGGRGRRRRAAPAPADAR